MFTFSYTRISFITFALFFFSKLSSIIKAFFSYWQISVFQSFSEVVLWKGKKRKKIKLLCLSVLILILDNKLKKKQLHITVGNLYTFFLTDFWQLWYCQCTLKLFMYFDGMPVAWVNSVFVRTWRTLFCNGKQAGSELLCDFLPLWHLNYEFLKKQKMFSKYNVIISQSQVPFKSLTPDYCLCEPLLCYFILSWLCADLMGFFPDCSVIVIRRVWQCVGVIML